MRHFEPYRCVATVDIAEEPNDAQQKEWLVAHGLGELATEEQYHRAYTVFSGLKLGDCAVHTAEKYYKDLVPFLTGFAVGQHDIGLVASFPFKMEVLPGPAIKQRPIQYPREQREFVRKEMQQLLEKGVVAVAPPGSFLHRTVLVAGRVDRPGQSGQEFRLCCDFREINRRTLMDPYPCPDLQDCLRRVESSTVFTSLDLKSGFHNIPIDPSSQPFVGVTTQDGSYVFKRMQFGLKNAPSHFQKVVTSVIDRGDVTVIVYLDDIIIHGRCPERVWSETLLVIERLFEAGFVLNTRKCHFLVSSMKMLGYQVGGGLIKPVFSQLEALVESKR